MAKSNQMTSLAAIRAASFGCSDVDLVDPQDTAMPAFEHFTCVNEYGFYCVPEAFRAREVPQVLLKGAVYEPATLALMRRIVGKGDIISGGAFIGDFLPALSEALRPGAVLHSFEPNPTSAAAARRTIALNGLANVALHPVAVGDADAVLPLQVSRGADAPMAARAKIVPSGSREGVIDVKVTTLDALIHPDRQISVLHLDIEGHEMPAILGAKALIQRNAPVIILEAAKAFNRRAYLKTLHTHFPQLQYEMVGVIERNCIFRPNIG